jgi:hypothetical protein
MRLLDKTFNCWYQHLPISFIQKDCNYDSGTNSYSEYILSDVKLVYFDFETAKNYSLKHLEKLVDNEITCRPLYQKTSFSYQPLFKIMISSYDKIKFDSMELQNKTNYIHFQSRFTVDGQKEYLIDHDIDRKIYKFAPLLASYFIHLYECNSNNYLFK